MASLENFRLVVFRSVAEHLSFCKTRLPCLPFRQSAGCFILAATLYLIGTGLSARTIRQVGVRPMLQGVLLWMVVAVGSLALIRAGWIHL